jgi:CheY-like chemotaxis protein
MEVARDNTEKQKVFTDEDTPINAAKTVVPLQYDISDVQPPLMVMVEVLDEGIGISEEMQRTLFKPFKQAMRRAGGTGLGIYSLSKRVESLGGKSGVSSRSDSKSGARFWFTLPYKPDDSAVAFLNNEPALSSIPTGSTDALQDVIENNGSSASDNHYIEEAGVSILLVEDSLLIQKTCTRAFQREGIVIDVANNGLECLEKVLQAMHGFKVLLMDVNMPLMDGLEATKRIREWERERGGDESGGGDKSVSSCSRLVIIGLSANSDSESTQEALEAGMDRFIGKPLKLSVLRECLADFDLALDSFKTVCDSKKI